MATIFAALIIITCILLIIIVLVQNPKGGGLSSSFGGSGTQLFGGVKKTTDFLDRGTWALAILLVVLVLAANVTLAPETGAEGPADSRVIDTELNEPITPRQPQNIPDFGGGQEQGGEGAGELPDPVEE